MPSQTFPDSTKASPAFTLGWGTLALQLAGALAFLAVLDRITAQTALITPINPLGLDALRGLGALGGLGVWALTIGPRILAAYRKAILLVMIPLGGFALGDSTAWRLADRMAFSRSAELFAAASYPVVAVKGGGKSHSYTLAIDPYHTGEPAELFISQAQYRALVDSYAGQCVTVDERRDANGAVEIRTRPPHRLPGGDLEVFPCGQPAAGRGAAG